MDRQKVGTLPITANEYVHVLLSTSSEKRVVMVCVPTFKYGSPGTDTLTLSVLLEQK